MLAVAKCDFVFLDMEHSRFSVETLKQAVRYLEAAKVPFIVRFCCDGSDTMIYQRALMSGLEVLRHMTDGI